MNSSEKYYRENLYPLQDGILKLVKELNFPFYLTGGTALSRFYYNHRYSDDFDFYVNDDVKFQDYSKRFFDYLQKNKDSLDFKLNIERTKTSSTSIRTYITKNDTELKLDFVNDISPHFGDFFIHKEYGRIDGWRNILSNKISALFRYELKDFIDVWIISKNNYFNWQEIISEAKEKELAIDPVEIFNVFRSFPFKNLDIIKWVHPIDVQILQTDFNLICKDILEGKNNSLSI